MIGTQSEWQQLARSAEAVFWGMTTMVILWFATNSLLNLFGAFSALDAASDPELHWFMLLYHSSYVAVGAGVAARLAPQQPIGHGVLVGVITFGLSLSGAVDTIVRDPAPAWYQIGLVVAAMPCGWLGGAAYVRFQRVVERILRAVASALRPAARSLAKKN